MKKLSNTWKLLISSLITALVLLWFLQSITITEVILVIRESSLRALLAFFLCSLLMSTLRTWRYQILLNIQTNSVSFWRMFLIVIVRNFCSDLLPARLGSLVFIPLAHKTLGVKISSASASFGAALFLDIAAMVPILLFALSMVVLGVEFDLDWLLIATGIVTFFVVTASALLVPALRLAKHILIKTRREDSRLHIFFQDIFEELNTYLQRNILLPVLLLSVLSRASKYAALLFLLQALLPPFGLSLDTNLFPGALVGLIAAELSASLPIAGIAGFGAYQGTWAIVFRMVGFDPTVADLTAISHSILAQAYGLGMGIVGIMLLGAASILTPLRKNQSNSRDKAMKYIPASSVLLFVSTLLLCTYLITTETNASDATHMQSDYQVTKDMSYPEPPSRLLSGGIIFDSRREGRFAIHFYDFDTRERSLVLSDNAHHLQFPNISSDGRYLTVSKSISTSRLAPSEVQVLDLKTREIVATIPRATFPTFIGNSTDILFERNRRQIWKWDFKTQKSQKIFPVKHLEWSKKFDDKQVVKPRPGLTENAISFISDYPSRWTSWYINLVDPSKNVMRQDSCQPVQSAQHQVYVSLANGDTRLKKLSSTQDTNAIKTFKNEQHSQYFPALIENEWLLYSAASAEKTDHDDGLYVIYLESLLSNERYQITQDATTNRWPRYVKSSRYLTKYLANGSE